MRKMSMTRQEARRLRILEEKKQRDDLELSI